MQMKYGSNMIDDLAKNVKEWNESGGTGILFTSAEDTMEKTRRIMEE